jgi:outer membrane protein assembly factor BamB
MELKTNWKNTVLSSNARVLEGLGTFSILKNDALLLTLNEVKNHAYSYKQGRMVCVSSYEVKQIFETDYFLGACTLDKEDIYLVSNEPQSDDNNNKNNMIFKLNLNGKMKWQFQIDGKIRSFPFVTESGVFITHFDYSNMKGQLIKLDKNGKLIFNQPLELFTAHPIILNNKHKIVLSYIRSRMFEIRDFDGKIVKQIPTEATSGIFLSKNKKDDLFGVFNNSVLSFDEELNILWKYEPKKGFAITSPIFDLEGNLYGRMNHNRLLSLDSQGKERWIVSTSGDVGLSMMLNNDNIILFTDYFKAINSNEAQLTTVIEVFSASGEKLLEDNLLGGVYHAIPNNNSFYLVTNGLHANRKLESGIYSVIIYSLSFK